jgi:uncharacterized protein (DUF2345 family)
MVGTIHTKEPTVYIQITQDNKILIHAPAGVTIETDQNINITAGGNINMTANGEVNIKGSKINLN